MNTIFRRLKNTIKNENGQVLVVVVASMIGLLGITAMVTDAGFLYVTQIQMQDSVDAAVLAGVQELPGQPQTAFNLASQYSTDNELSLGEFNYTIENNTRIHGTATRQVDLFFARALGIPTATVNVQATAQIAPLSEASGLVPWGVWEHDYTFGEATILKQGAGDQLYPGWFGALRFEGDSGANDYRSNIKYGYPGVIHIGDIVPYEPGNMSGPTKQGVQYRLDLCPHTPKCTIAHYQTGCPRIVFVPIINQVDVGHKEVRVCGFAAFMLEDYVGSGHDNQVRGAFIEYVIPGMSSPDAEDFGLYTTQLIE